MTLFGWHVHRGECACPNYPKCTVRFDDLMRERKRSEVMERLWLDAERKLTAANKLGHRIAAQRRQIRRLKALLGQREGQ